MEKLLQSKQGRAVQKLVGIWSRKPMNDVPVAYLQAASALNMRLVGVGVIIL